MYLTHTLAHFFYPCQSNNHKAKFLHSSSLLFLILALLTYQVILQFSPAVGLKVLGYAANISPSEVISLTNQQREEVGLLPLEYSSSLEAAARIKGEHMLKLDYWAHVAPDGTEPWIFFTNQGYQYRYAGENLARDFANPESAISAWMASPSHKENMLSGKYREIGVAVVEGDLAGVETTIIVQLFGTRLADTATEVQIAEAGSQGSSATSILTQGFEPTQAPFMVEVSPFPSQEDQIIAQAEPRQSEAEAWKVLISPFDTTRSISLFTIVALLAIMVIDGIVVSRKKITRIGGRTFAHLAFLGMVLALVLIARAGEIL